MLGSLYGFTGGGNAGTSGWVAPVPGMAGGSVPRYFACVAVVVGSVGFTRGGGAWSSSRWPAAYGFFTIRVRKNRLGSVPLYSPGLAGVQFNKSELLSRITFHVVPAS